VRRSLVFILLSQISSSSSALFILEVASRITTLLTSRMSSSFARLHTPQRQSFEHVFTNEASQSDLINRTMHARKFGNEGFHEANLVSTYMTTCLIILVHGLTEAQFGSLMRIFRGKKASCLQPPRVRLLGTAWRPGQHRS
jgi:hypothetical protein